MAETVSISMDPAGFDAVVKMVRELKRLRAELDAGFVSSSDISERIDAILRDFNEAANPPASSDRSNPAS